MINKRYSFDKEKHIHTLDGKPLTGVTTVLGVIAKPALIQWSANMAVDHILANVVVAGSDTTIIKTESIEEARSAHRIKKEKAGGWGTEVHSWIEQWIMSSILGKELPDPLYERQGQACRHFINWATDNKVKFLESEKNVYSEKMFLGGICDIVCEIDGEIWLVDIKTGGVYAEAFWQMSAYQLCLEEMALYQGIKGHIVLGLLKTGEFIEKRSISNEDNRKAFLACLDIYRIKQKVEKTLL